MAKSIFVAKTTGGMPAIGEFLGHLVTELRPREWIKNIMVLAPLFFSQNILSLTATQRSLAALVMFCIVSSSVYLLNDIKDREQDRLHPVKRLRPIAAGKLSVPAAGAAVVTLLLIGLVGGGMLSGAFGLILLAYWLINVLYSGGLKNQIILDVFAIAAGFVLRVAGGAIVIDVEMSHWLVLCTTLLALFLGLSKRRHELVLLGEDAGTHRRVLKEYSAHFLDMMIGIVTACTVMSYALYTVSEETIRRFNTDHLIFTLPFVLYGIFRYLYLVYHRNQGGNPAKDLLTDSSIVINLCLWAAVTAFIIYR
jgi:4-hydroxybenzoate polyprenyltransferase